MYLGHSDKGGVRSELQCALSLSNVLMGKRLSSAQASKIVGDKLSTIVQKRGKSLSYVTTTGIY